ncbi:MAG: molybdopterin-binding protein [Planctomycetota bacterium]
MTLHLTAEIIAIGDEMIGGARLDTNTQWLARRLGELGVEVCFHTTVGDTMAHNIDAFRIAMRRVDIVVCTGGLGPTRDDLTREAIASALGRPLKLDESLLRHIESLFQTRGRPMPERNQDQAMLPLGASAIHNPQGTAPGVDASYQREDETQSRIFALPGVPAEMKPMFDQSVVAAILQSASVGSRQRERVIQTDVMKFFGVGESDMEQRLGDMIARDRQPRVGITVSKATISLRITAMGESAQQCRDAIESTRKDILDRVGDLHFGDGESFELQHALDQSLRAAGQSLLVIELGYAAPIGDWMAALGPSPAQVGALSLATTADVIRLASNKDADQMESVEMSMAALRTSMGADWALIVDAYPDLNGSGDQPVPAVPVRFLVMDPNGTIAVTTDHIGGHPSIIAPRIGKAAMAWMRRCLKGVSALAN